MRNMLYWQVMAPTRPFFIILVQACTIISNTCNGETIPKFPAILIFGDSTVDTGNNNYITTSLRGDHSPYGQDFPDNVSTGRFSNGRLIPDFLASMLGIKETVPPFLEPNLSDYDLRTGVSFASAGSGYDDLTAAVSDVIPVSKQPGYFKTYIERLRKIVGEEEAQKIISGALVVVSAGTNDFAINFYDIPTRRLQANIDVYQDYVQNNMRQIVEELYHLGCRTIAIPGLPPIGCLPIQMTAKLEDPILRKCLQDQNSDAQSYNAKLEKLLTRIQASLQGSKILYADIYAPLMDMINNPQKYGFIKTTSGCCGTGLLEAGPLCTTISPVCSNASQYLFFDSIHPTESAYQHLTEDLKKQIIPKLS